MATVTSPIILDSTGQNIKNSIDALTTAINNKSSTAQSISFDDSSTRITANNVQNAIEALDLEARYSNWGYITPQTNETWASVLGRLRSEVFSQFTNKLNYGRLSANVDGQQGTVFQPYRVYSSATTTHWAAIRGSGTALVVYVISTTSSNAYLRKYSFTTSGLTIEDLSSNNATEIRLTGMNV